MNRSIASVLPAVAADNSEQLAPPAADREVMEPHLVVHYLGADHVVVELHEQLTAPGPAVELHVVLDPETGETAAWWEDDRGILLRAALVGIS
jgi:hypothetical protein